MRGRALLAAACAIAGVLAPATAARAEDPARAVSCTLLIAGTAGVPELVSAPVLELLRAGKDPLAVGPAAPAGLLPDRIDLRTATETFNSRFYFALRDGKLWFKPNVERGGGDGPWRSLPLPACFKGHVTSISADGNLLLAVDDQRRIFTMDNARQTPLSWNWSLRYGPPLWINGNGQKIPADAKEWQLSALSSVEDKTWTDPAGHAQTVGGGNVTTVFVLRGDGRRITFLDPWLPNDYSYEECAPERGRLELESIAASGSTVFAIDRFGDMYTRLWDFDISGADTLFFKSTYEDQSGKPVPKFSLPSYIQTGIPGLDALPIQLPAPTWVKQPKVAGEITSAITIYADAAGSANRVLRVEGRDAGGDTGYWQKRITQSAAADWTFHRTDRPLRRPLLDNTPGDSSALALGPSSGIDYVRAEADGFSARVLDFSPACTPSTLRVTADGAPPFDLILHTVDALRQNPRGEGLDGAERAQLGTIEVPPAIFDNLAAQPAPVREFIARRLGNKRFTSTNVTVRTGLLALRSQGWEFRP